MSETLSELVARAKYGYEHGGGDRLHRDLADQLEHLTLFIEDVAHYGLHSKIDEDPATAEKRLCARARNTLIWNRTSKSAAEEPHTPPAPAWVETMPAKWRAKFGKLEAQLRAEMAPRIRQALQHELGGIEDPDLDRMTVMVLEALADITRASFNLNPLYKTPATPFEKIIADLPVVPHTPPDAYQVVAHSIQVEQNMAAMARERAARLPDNENEYGTLADDGTVDYGPEMPHV